MKATELLERIELVEKERIDRIITVTIPAQLSLIYKHCKAAADVGEDWAWVMLDEKIYPENLRILKENGFFVKEKRSRLLGHTATIYFRDPSTFSFKEKIQRFWKNFKDFIERFPEPR